MLTLWPLQQVFAAEIAVGSSTRKEILDAARPMLLPDNKWKFRVVEIWASEDWAFLCTFEQDEQGRLSSTDESLDIDQVILHRSKGVWQVISVVESFAEPSSTTADCRLGKLAGKSTLTNKIIEDALTQDPWLAGKRQAAP